MKYTEHMNRWRSILSVLIALWLPLQGYGAVTMPFCEHGMGVAANAAELGHSGDLSVAHPGHGAASHGHHAADHSSHANTATDKGSPLACNNCGACHLACSPLLLSAPVVLAVAETAVFETKPLQSFLSFTPEQLQRPPLPAFV